MSGVSSGYAIADGSAGFAASQKQGATTNDRFKVEGSVTGKTDMRASTTAAKDAVATAAAASNQNANAQIITTAQAGLLGGSAYSDSIVGIVGANSQGISSTTITLTGASANSNAWDGTSAAVKNADNANAQTAISGVNTLGKMITNKEDSNTAAPVGDADTASIRGLIFTRRLQLQSEENLPLP